MRIAYKYRLYPTQEQQNSSLRNCAKLAICITVRLKNDPTPGSAWNFHHELSCGLIAGCGLIAMEDLHIRGLTRSRLARSVHDAGWGSFLAMLAYKAGRARRELGEGRAAPDEPDLYVRCAGSESLGQRGHECQACGLAAPRDVVSAQVILERARIGRSRPNEVL